MSKKNHIIITTLLICSFLLLTVQIVRAGTHSSHFALNWWSFGNSCENAVKIEPAHRTSRAIASESKSHPEIGWL